MKSEVAISLKNVSKTYIVDERGNTLRERVLNAFSTKGKKKIEALKDISFEVKKGERFGVIGRNGSGKSTLLQIMNKALHPNKGGIVEFSGSAIRLALGMGFESQLTARQNIYLNSSVLGLRIKEIDKIFDHIVQFAELEDFVDTPVKFYSSGMKSKLMFSIAVHAKADIFLMDEFFGGVGDVKFKAKSDDLFNKKILGDSTIVIVSHSMNVINQYCQRAMLLEKGELITIGEPAMVIQKYEELTKTIK